MRPVGATIYRVGFAPTDRQRLIQGTPNNEAERTIRHAVVGRKNYYGAATHGGADTAATLFSIIESCKKNDIDPRSFLLMSLQCAARNENLITPLAYARKLRQ